MVQIPRLREWREARALTQVELAELAAVSSRSVAGYEAGAGARPPTVRKLAEVLAVEVADLRGDPDFPKVVASRSPQLTLNGALEEERRATIRDQLASWRGMHEESVARWSRALEREPAFDSFDAAAAFCAEIIAEGAVGQTIITRHLIPQAGILLPEDEAAQERQEFLETHAHLEEGMHAVVDVVEGMVDSETDADAASKAIGRYLDQVVSHAVGDAWEERRDRPDFQLWLKRETRRRREAGAKTKAQSEEGGRKRPTA